MTTAIPWSMKTRGPGRAAGWISMPVRNRETCDTKRAVTGQPARQTRWANRWKASAWRPGEQRSTSRRLRAAGSRVIAASMSRRIASNTADLPGPGGAVVGRGGPQRIHHQAGRVAPVVGESAQGRLDGGRRQLGQLRHGAALNQLGGQARGGDRRPAAVGLEPRLDHPAVEDPE